MDFFMTRYRCMAYLASPFAGSSRLSRTPVVGGTAVRERITSRADGDPLRGHLGARRCGDHVATGFATRAVLAVHSGHQAAGGLVWRVSR
jgi:hypothetical protein